MMPDEDRPSFPGARTIRFGLLVLLHIGMGALAIVAWRSGAEPLAYVLVGGVGVGIAANPTRR